MDKTKFEQNILDATMLFANSNGIPFGVHHENMVLNAIRHTKKRYSFIGWCMGGASVVLIMALILLFSHIK